MKLVFQLFILFLPTQLAYHFWPDFSYIFGVRVDLLAPTVYFSELLFLLTIVLWAREKSVRSRIIKHKTALLAFFLFAFVNIWLAKEPAIALFRWVKVGEAAGLWFFIKNNSWALMASRKPFIISLFVTLALGVTQMALGENVGGVLYWIGERNFSRGTPGISLVELFGKEVLRPYATFGHPNALAGYALAVLFLFWKDKLILFLSGALVLISFSQNAWFALIATPLVYYSAIKIKDGFAKFVRMAVASSFFLTIAKPGNMPSEIFQRIELNNAAGILISQSPMFGVGLGNFVTQLTETAGLRPIWLLQPVHNVFLLVASEAGIVGLVLFTLFVSRNMGGRNALAVVAIVMTGLFDHYWISLFQNMMVAALVIGCYNSGSKEVEI